MKLVRIYTDEGVTIYCADCREVLPTLERESVALSVWSPPYFVGKDYEKHFTFADWRDLLESSTFALHFERAEDKPEDFSWLNTADILCFADRKRCPKVQASHRPTPSPDHHGRRDARCGSARTSRSQPR